MAIFSHLGDAALMTAGMIWQTAWSLILGFTISAFLQATVKADELRKVLGDGSPAQIMLAATAGAASSSCSYASAAIMRTLFKKGAALVCAMAFMVASTNLVLELGLILLVLLGWKFMLGQWIGGAVMIAILSVLIKLTAPRRPVQEARAYPEADGGHDHGSMVVEGDTFRSRMANPRLRIVLAQSFAMEWRMLWKDLMIGFVVGGPISVFVPNEVWKAVFCRAAPAGSLCRWTP